MTDIPPRQHDITAQIDKAHEATAEPPRPHMGVSMIGHPCERWLWLSFRWAVRPEFSGRVLRLFRRGQLEEHLIQNDLGRIGLKVVNDQERVDFGSHVSGSIDGMIMSGVPDSPNKVHLVEMKTHNKASFTDLTKKGVKKSKPLHWAQMQCYMLGMEVDRALYYAVCKDDDTIYTERVKLDQEAAEKLVERAKRIALDDRLPPPISTDPTWWQCKMCDGHDFCHGSKRAREANCRTCAHVTPKEDSTFHCEKWGAAIPPDFQRKGCEKHIIHPDLVPWKIIATDGDSVTWDVDGKQITNGPEDYHSGEILSHPEVLGDPGVELLREVFDARVGE